MRGLFEVFIVDVETGTVASAILVARDKESARVKAVMAERLEKDVDEYDIFVNRIGDVRSKKETPVVKIAKDGE